MPPHPKTRQLNTDDKSSRTFHGAGVFLLPNLNYCALVSVFHLPSNTHICPAVVQPNIRQVVYNNCTSISHILKEA